jgi:hypothetical protein
MRSVPIVFVVAAQAGCLTGYRPGSFVMAGEPFVGDRVQTDCLDVAVKVSRESVAPGPVVDYQFGNRCDRVATIDLKSVRVTGRTASGEELAMVAYDPYGTMVALPLDARTAGRERIEYRTARDWSGEVVSVCVSVGDLAGAGAASPAMTCHDVAPGTAAVAEVTP